MPAIELRPEEIGVYDFAKAREVYNRVRSAGMKAVASKPQESAAIVRPIVKGVKRYEFPIGPTQFQAQSRVGWVRYSVGNQTMKRIKYHARAQRKRHELDVVLYPYAIGPHPLTEAEKRKAESRDWLNVSVATSPFRAKEIIAEVMARHEINSTDFYSRRRFKEISACRKEACYRLKHETNLSLPQIARLVGFADHTSALHAICSFEKVLADRSPAAALVEG